MSVYLDSALVELSGTMDWNSLSPPLGSRMSPGASGFTRLWPVSGGSVSGLGIWSREDIVS